MRKTTFAGLNVVGPTESIYADNAAFTTRDRDEIDRALRIGVKTHRHTGLAGLTNPDQAPSAAVLASGGTIDSGLSITVGYTLEDSQAGETMISPLTVVTTPVPLDVPLNAPVASADYSAGTLLADTYTYAITYIDGEGGETPLGPSTIVTRDPGYAKAQVKLSGLTTGLVAAGAVGWRLFRARGGGVYVLLATGDSGTDTFTDDGSVSADCDTHPPTDNINTTNKINRLQVTIPSGGVIEDATFINLYATIDNDFGESSLLAQYPVGSAGQSPIFESLDFLDSQPPDVNRSYGGASMIDPDSELLDWHWKRPVEDSASLPSGVLGDIRLVRAERKLYGVFGASAFDPGDWDAITGGGGASGGSGIVVKDQTVVVDPADEIEFVASGAAQVAVSEPLGGKALVTIFAEEQGTVKAVQKDGGAPVMLPSAVSFEGEDATTVDVSDAGGGSALVKVKSPQPSGGTIRSVEDEDTQMWGPKDLKFVGASGATVGLVDGGGGSGVVTIGAPGAAGASREWASAFLTLGSGASGNVDFTGSAAAMQLLEISTNKRARVRAYGDDVARTADLARAIGVDPTGDHGVQLDYANTAHASGGKARITPIVEAANLDDPAQNLIRLNVTNYDGAGDVVVAFLYIPTEVA